MDKLLTLFLLLWGASIAVLLVISISNEVMYVGKNGDEEYKERMNAMFDKISQANHEEIVLRYQARFKEIFRKAHDTGEDIDMSDFMLTLDGYTQEMMQWRYEGEK